MKQLKILIIEDDIFLQELYRDLLTQEGYIVATASTGNEGYEKIEQDDWDLILLDIILPQIDGFQIIKKLTAEKQQQLKSRIVFLTNLDNPQEKTAALAVGKDYLIKSQLTPADFLDKMKEYLPKK
jgi:DNA-binding response OmpR family regulator